MKLLKIKAPAPWRLLNIGNKSYTFDKEAICLIPESDAIGLPVTYKVIWEVINDIKEIPTEVKKIVKAPKEIKKVVEAPKEIKKAVEAPKEKNKKAEDSKKEVEETKSNEAKK